MKTFSDLLATKIENQIFLQITPVSANGFPSVWVSINDRVVYRGLLQSMICVKQEFALASRLKVEIGLEHKQYSAERETAVIIDSLRINSFELIPGWSHLACYINERHVNEPASYLGFNGVWCLETDDCFHRWWHRSTGQGWLLDPRTGSRDCVPSSSNTNARIGRSEPVDNAGSSDSILVPPTAPGVR